jgi:hypothetical protein
MSNQSQFGDLVLINSLQDPLSSTKLQRIQFAKASGTREEYDEAWLQNVIMRHPGLLAISQIEPIFVDMVPICTELPMRDAGFADNLFITPRGDIALVECKLWRNPEARREVVAQVLHYASELATWSYEALETAVKRARALDPAENTSNLTLAGMVSPGGELDAVAFHDAVVRNLRHGRFLLLIAGDGIREGLETLTGFLQKNAGLHFTLAIVEVALFRLPQGGYVAQPRVVGRTTNIQRVVFSVGEAEPEASAAADSLSTSSNRGATITEEAFFQELESGSPGMPVLLHSFLVQLAVLNVLPDFGLKSLTLRWVAEDLTNWNLGSIATSGQIWFDYHAGQARNMNLLEVSKEYLSAIAALIPGAIVKPTKSGTAWNISDRNGHSLLVENLLNEESRRQGWLRAIQQFQVAIARSRDA